MRPNALRRPHPLVFVALAVTAGLAGCPDTPSSPDTKAPDVEVTDTPEDGDGGGFEVIPGACQTVADCATTGLLPVCQQLACVDGQCTTAAAADGTACDDGDLCTSGSQCQDGVCGQGDALPCDDGNECTNDACDPASGCVHTYHQKPCDDGSVCTTGDHCFKGVCQGTAVDCDDQNACTDDKCDKVAGCQWTQRTGACTDGNACTQGDQCVDGLCVPGAEVDCDDASPCTTDVCEPAVGCQYTILDGACDDADACTTGDLCKDGACVGTLVKCDDGNPCTSDYCDPAVGCVFTPHTGACSDGDPCTLDDKCSAGACVPGAPDPLCCDADEGCDDGDACTLDACVDGYCAFTAMDCDDGSPCTLDACVDGLCQQTPYGPLGGGALLAEGFEEAALAGWTLTSNNSDVVWQRDTTQSHTGAASLYVGKVPNYTYDFGLTQATASRQVALPPGQSTLRLWVFHDVAEDGCSYDRTEILVDGVIQTPLVCDNEPTWKEYTYDLTPWAGATITVGIRFDTVDGAVNDGQGVWIDDLAIDSQAPEGCCLTTDDCEVGGEGCLANACHPELFVCGIVPAEVACDDENPCTVDACDGDGACTHTESAPGCCVTDAECPGEDALPCATGVCLDGTCTLDASACCEGDEACPGDPARPCATPVCQGGFCGLDESACCEATGCDDGEVCTVDTCQADGACAHEVDPACCEADEDCEVGQACETATCQDGACVVDASECCAEASECPGPEPGSECQVPTCTDGVCGFDVSGC